MLLDILRELGVEEGFNPYSYDGDSDEEDETEATLDPVDCAGCASRSKLYAAARAMGWATFILATSILYIPGAFEDAVLAALPSSFGGGKETRTTMMGTLASLVAWGMLVDVTEQRCGIAMFCALFTVAKSTQTLRLIFDGRELNALCNRPPPVCLPSIVDVLETAEHTRIIIAGDLRHWFHQLSVPDQVKRFLGVKCNKRIYKYQTLPMGLSWSPWLAQTVSLILLTHAEKGSKRFFDMSWTSGERLPTKVAVLKEGVTVGFACIVYDNFGIFLNIDDEKFAKEIADRLIANARHFDIQWKELQLFTPRASMLLVETICETRKKCPEAVDSTETFDVKVARTIERKNRRWGPYEMPTFLGVEVDISEERIRWRHTTKRIEKITSLQCQGELSRRQIARIVGSVIWDALISLKRLGEVEGIIAQLRTTAKEVMRKRDWNSAANTQPSEKWRLLAETWRDATKENPWHYNRPHIEGATEIWLCSDAADRAIGGVEMSRKSPAVLDCWHEEDGKWSSGHIFLKEVLAAIRTIRWCANRHCQAGALRLIVLMGSIPARRALQRGYSSNSKASRMITRMWRWADTNDVDLCFVDADTSFNVADCLTRDWSSKRMRSEASAKAHNFHRVGEFCDERVENSWRILAGHMPGRLVLPIQGPWRPAKPFEVGSDESSSDSDDDDDDDMWQELAKANSRSYDD